MFFDIINYTKIKVLKKMNNISNIFEKLKILKDHIDEHDCSKENIDESYFRIKGFLELILKEYKFDISESSIELEIKNILDNLKDSNNFQVNVMEFKFLFANLENLILKTESLINKNKQG